MARRKAQSPSDIVILLFLLSLISTIIVTSIIANAQLYSIFETHWKERTAFLVAQRLTGLSGVAIGEGPDGIHKNVLDERLLDRLSLKSRDAMPYDVFVYCYNWRALVAESNSEKTWEFGAKGVKNWQGTTTTVTRGGGRSAAPVGAVTVEQRIRELRENDAGEYTIPVTIAKYEGGMFRNYTGGTLSVFVWQNKDQCDKPEDKEKQFITATNLIARVSSFPPPAFLGEYPYLSKTVQTRSGMTTFKRCEEMEKDKIALHFSTEDSEKIFANGRKLTAEIESASEKSGVDPNLVRAALFLETKFENVDSGRVAETARKLRDALDYKSASSAGECSLNYAFLYYLAGQTALDGYIDGVSRPSDSLARTVGDYSRYYTTFSNCREVA